MYEFAFMIACVTMIGQYLNKRRLSAQVRNLLAENSVYGECLLGPHDENDRNLAPHLWGESKRDVLYVSKSPWSSECVVLEVSSCQQCKMVSRHIVKGESLAKKQGLLNKEGFFFAGVKVTNIGCVEFAPGELDKPSRKNK